MIVFTSRTGNVRNVVKQLHLLNIELKPNLVINQPYLLFTYTDGLGNTPKSVEEFLEIINNQINIKGVIASGNTNFGLNFCKAADLISEKYSIPVVRKIDLRGSTEDLEVIKTQYKKLIEGEMH
jgi:protein involved in ribonucleotide reduction